MRLPLSLFLIAAAATARAADPSIPLILAHEGRLLTANDTPVEGQVKLTFRIYAVPRDLDPNNPTAAIWTGNFTDVPVSKGLYAVELGAKLTEPLPASTFDGSAQRWLGVSVEGGAELTPRLRLASVAHAYLAARALDSDKLGGKDPAYYLDASHLTGTLPEGILPTSGLLDALTASAPLNISRSDVTTITIGEASNTSRGTLSAADKAKLDGLGAGAKVATVTGSGAVSVTGTTDVTIALGDASPSQSGAMSAADKTKLNGIGDGAKITAVTGTGAITVTGTTAPVIGLADATASQSGAMSAADKTKLDAVPANAGILTGTSRPSSPRLGTMFLHTTNRTLEFFDGSSWRNLARPVPKTCKELKAIDSSAPTGVYVIHPNDTVGDIRAFCDQDTNGGGWTLVSNRRAKAANIEACGANLGEFFNVGCNTVDSIGYLQSYALPASHRTALGQAEVLIMQYTSAGVADPDDAYILTTTTDLFPNSAANVNNFTVTKVCDVNGLNCISNNVYFKFLATGHYSNTNCNGGQDGSSYGGNYGLCATGISTAYQSSGTYGNRIGYDETKLWNYPTGADLQERIYVR